MLPGISRTEGKDGNPLMGKFDKFEKAEGGTR
jgi:hypothetical protein